MKTSSSSHRHPNNIGGNYYDKYATKNPAARLLVRHFLYAFDELAASSHAKTAYEIGCGEGMLSLRLAAKGLQVRGSDVEPDIVHEANKRALQLGYDTLFRTLNLFDIKRADAAADLLVCCEVLEHIPQPSSALDYIARLVHSYVLMSVPREPIWRALNLARGRYILSLGNTPGHVNHWSARQFIDDVSRRFEILAIRKPLPWTMVLCRVREGLSR